ncbi:MAG: DUF1385 domain-containing protein [Anaerolineales bacterium]
MEDRIITYGGQALIEGVMMRGQRAAAAAMRAPNGEIVIYTEKLGGIYHSRIAKIPFVRGVILLWDALGLGMRMLTLSANTQTGEDEKLEGPALYLTLGLSMLFAIALFFLTPYGVGELVKWLFNLSTAQSAGAAHLASAASAPAAPPLFGPAVWVAAAAEGITRLALLVGYIWAIGQIEDIKRVFQYHGAEHKTINAFEAGAELTPESVAKFPLEHPRCGTSFLLTLVVLTVLVFSFLHPLPVWMQILGRIVLIPVLAGVAVEYIRWTANNLASPLVRAIVRPNLALQRLTTREPDHKMLEVSIAAFQSMRKAEQDFAA